jgi:hypothetical protein
VLSLEGETAGRAGRWRVSYDERVTVGPLRMPDLIRYAEPGRSFDEGVEIKIKERMATNRAYPPEAFTLEAPPGYPIQIQRCPP